MIVYKKLYDLEGQLKSLNQPYADFAVTYRPNSLHWQLPVIKGSGLFAYNTMEYAQTGDIRMEDPLWIFEAEMLDDEAVEAVLMTDNWDSQDCVDLFWKKFSWKTRTMKRYTEEQSELLSLCEPPPGTIYAPRLRLIQPVYINPAKTTLWLKPELDDLSRIGWEGA